MKHLLTKVSTIVLAAAMLLTSGCYREIEERIDAIDQEILEIDDTMAAMEATINSLSQVYATIKNVDALKDYAESLRSDLEALQTAFDTYKENAEKTYATGEQLIKVNNLAKAINDDLLSLADEVGALSQRVDGIDKAVKEAVNEAIKNAQASIAELSNLVYFITMEIVPEAVVDGSPAVLFKSDSKSAKVSVTLEVAPASRIKELVDHISFSIIPVTTVTRAADAIIIDAETYTVEEDKGRLTVSASLPKKAPFIDPDYNLWNVDQAFVISAKYSDDNGIFQLATPYVSAFLTDAGGSIPKTISMILGEKNAFWEAVAEGAADAAELEGDMTVEVTYCSTQKEQAAAIQNLYSGSKKNKGLIVYPINEHIEDEIALADEDLNIPIVVVGKELAPTSALAKIAKTQVVIKDTAAIKKLSAYIINDAHKNVLVMKLEDSEESDARVKIAQKYLEDVTVKELTTTLEKAETKLSTAIELFDEFTAVVLLDDEFVTPDILKCAKNIKTYAFGASSAIKTGVKSGDIRIAMFKNGYKFGAKGFDALFNTAPNPCIIEAEALLPEKEVAE